MPKMYGWASLENWDGSNVITSHNLIESSISSTKCIHVITHIFKGIYMYLPIIESKIRQQHLCSEPARPLAWFSISWRKMKIISYIHANWILLIQLVAVSLLFKICRGLITISHGYCTRDQHITGIHSAQTVALPKVLGFACLDSTVPLCCQILQGSPLPRPV